MNERAISLFESFEHEEDKSTKTQVYNRSYWKKNNSKLNKNKKRYRQMHKEREYGNLSTIFEESEVTPSKVTPQTVETYEQHSKVDDYPSMHEERRECQHCKEEDNQGHRLGTPRTTHRQANRQSAKLQGLTIDKAAFFLNFPGAFTLSILAGVASWFVAGQTQGLYKSLDFPSPELASYGALVIAIGCAGFYKLTGRILAKRLLAGMVLYELLLVFAGTRANQADLSYEALRVNPSYLVALEIYDIAKTSYDKKKARFEDKKSDVYKNSWYEKKHLNPALEKYRKEAANLKALESEFEAENHRGWLHLVLKVLFRITAIMLTVMLAESALVLGFKSVRITDRSIVCGLT